MANQSGIPPPRLSPKPQRLGRVVHLRWVSKGPLLPSVGGPPLASLADDAAAPSFCGQPVLDVEALALVARLPIAWTFIEIQGTISAESRADGGGTFHFTLLLANAL